MVKIGNFFFKTRNYLFPFFYIILFLPFPRISKHFTAVYFIGLVIALMGQVIRMLTIGLVYIVRGGRNKRIYAEDLVTDGIFSHCRNPMYLGNVLLVIGMSVLSNSVFAIVVMIPLFIFIYQAIIRAEEAFLRNQFHDDFETYCVHVNRWIPNLHGIGRTWNNTDFRIKRVLFKEYNTSLVWLLGATLLAAFNSYYFQVDLSFLQYRTLFLITIIVLFTIYLTIRFFKKKEQRQVRIREKQNIP